MIPVEERIEVTGWSKIYAAFEELGFGKVNFGSEFESIYADFHWVLMPHPIAKTRFYAIPPVEKLHSVPWDSWYFINGEPTHHIHYTQPADSRCKPWIQPVPAPECPEELVGIQWYWYNESIVTPSLLIK